jgi:hypothetical protein
VFYTTSENAVMPHLVSAVFSHLTHSVFAIEAFQAFSGMCFLPFTQNPIDNFF